MRKLLFVRDTHASLASTARSRRLKDALSMAALLTAILMARATAVAERLAAGSNQLGDGWNEGILVEADGCLAIAMQASTTSGTTQLLLGAIDKLQFV